MTWARALLLSLVLAGPAAGECRQALALGLDVSGSVDSREYRLQLDGLAAALNTPAVRDVLLGDPEWPVRLAVFEWSGPRKFNRRLLLDWTAIRSEADLSQVTTTLQDTTRRAADPSTALGEAMRFGTALLASQSDCPKRTLDISGDGKSNTGPRPHDIDSPTWLTVNGLTIGDPDARRLTLQELSAYYTANVIRGPGAFVETALGFDDYEQAMARKLLRELEGLSLAHLR
ncbi:DUF1194 domain-containing protein [Shimia sediminis]|uniref:DUF1194 domain-containing protein n=1 Tax=Shimia sediminis TaxID=2497945 RepID=UPI000F8D2D3B|nr:DUF1194 domain-containing protein [Shimia sediminis]